MYDLISARPWQHLTVEGLYGGQSIVNVFAFRMAFPSGVTVATNGSGVLLTAFRTSWRVIIAALSSTYRVIRYKVRDLNTSIATGTPSKHWLYEHEDELAGDISLDTGGSEAASLPTGAVANITLRTARVGRRFRGRKAFGPIPEISTTDTAGNGNLLTAGAISFIRDGFDLLLNPADVVVGGDTLQMVWQVHSLVMAVASPISDWSNDVTSYVVQPNVGSQNSRKAKNSGV